MTRQRRDPAEKAQDALDIAERKVAKLAARRAAMLVVQATNRAELDLAREEAAHLAQSPHLTRQATGDYGEGAAS